MNHRKIEIELSERKDPSIRRWPCTVSTETPVARRDAYGEAFSEILSHAPGAVDLSRAPLPVLEGHNRAALNIGVVEDLRLDGAKLRGTLVLGASKRAEELAADIDARIVRNLSVGYTIAKETRDEKKRTITADRWIPYEVSLVSCPADTSAGINRSSAMNEETEAGGSEGTETNPSAEVLAERARAAEIRKIVKRAKLGDEMADSLIERGVSLADARVDILDKLAERSDAIKTDGHIRVPIGFDGVEFSDRAAVMGAPGDDFQRAATDALLMRAGIPVKAPHAAARDVSPRVLDIARTCLSRAGKSAGGWLRGSSAAKIIERAQTTSDFPAILGGSLNAAIRNGYENEPSTHRLWVRPVQVTDFRDQVRPILGSAPSLAPVLEHGEYTNGNLSDDSTSYKVTKFGRVVELSWESLTNDDLFAFMRLQPALGQAARRAEADAVYAILAANTGAGPAMQDGTNLFHSTHGNLTSAGAFDAALLGAGRALLRKMTALGGGYLALQPKAWIVPVERETAAEVVISNATRAVVSEKATPEWISSLQLVAEPRLANTAAFLAADNSQIDTIELGLLEENLSGPTIEQIEDPRKDCFAWKVRHVFGSKALDWRGLVRMPISG
jgi:HK97 family phage prohead protease